MVPDLARSRSSEIIGVGIVWIVGIVATSSPVLSPQRAESNVSVDLLRYSSIVVGHRMCHHNCRTFLWGGAGVPADGGCFCVCDNENWSGLNILGGASCVPVKAHRIFGWAGLAVSVISLGHAAYHLRRQVSACRQFLRQYV